MSYQVLARKWRPRTFREMVGQEHVLQALINALDHNRLHHAYLFTGTRGVGKTTIARILAKCLNCEAGVSSEPCGQCGACTEISEGRFVDLIEVDAASRTKVEDTRELLDNVQYAPTRGRYKVYLIDEVHMLSSHSFNALLKTLEEPPPHVKFLLATTDPQKLPVTILSRCLQFNLKNMNPERIVQHLQFVLEKEMVPFEESALWQLGRSADGSMRDAMSLADQAIAFGSGKVTEADVRAMLGTIDQTLVYDILSALASLDSKTVLDSVASLSEHAPDYGSALAELLAVLHRVAIGQALPEAVDNSQGDRDRILTLSQSIPPEDVQLFYQTALLGRRDLPLAPDPRSGFEMVLLRMLAFKPQGVGDVPTQALPAQSASSSPESHSASESVAALSSDQSHSEVADPEKKPQSLTEAAPTAASEAVVTVCEQTTESKDEKAVSGVNTMTEGAADTNPPSSMGTQALAADLNGNADPTSQVHSSGLDSSVAEPSVTDSSDMDSSNTDSSNTDSNNTDPSVTGSNVANVTAASTAATGMHASEADRLVTSVSNSPGSSSVNGIADTPPQLDTYEEFESRTDESEQDAQRAASDAYFSQQSSAASTEAPAVIDAVIPAASQSDNSATMLAGADVSTPEVAVSKVVVSEAVPLQSSKPQAQVEQAAQPTSKKAKVAKVPLSQTTPDNWPQVYLGLGVGGVLQSTVSNCVLTGRQAYEMFFLLDENFATLYDDSHQQRLADLLTDYYGEPISVTIQLGVVERETPAAIAIREKAQRQRQAVETIQNDPIVQGLIEHFGAVIDPESIRPIDG